MDSVADINKDKNKIINFKDELINLKKSFKSLKWYEWLMAIVMIAIASVSVYDAFVHPDSAKIPLWLTIVNFVSAICGVVCIFFCAKASISNYAFGLVNTLVYIVYLTYRHIWGTLGLEILVYLPADIIGWIFWVRHRDKIDTEKTMAKKLDAKQNVIYSIAVIIVGIVCYFILNRLDGTTPLLDAFVVSMGVIATILQFLRYREQYVWWLIQDIIAVAMYGKIFLSTHDFGDAVYLTKKTIYLIMAFIGLYNWIKLQKTRNRENV